MFLVASICVGYIRVVGIPCSFGQECQGVSYAPSGAAWYCRDDNQTDSTCELWRSREYYGAVPPNDTNSFLWFYEISGAPPRGNVTGTFAVAHHVDNMELSFDLKFASRGADRQPISTIVVWVGQSSVMQLSSAQIGNSTHYKHYKHKGLEYADYIGDQVVSTPSSAIILVVFVYNNTGDIYLNSSTILNTFIGNVELSGSCHYFEPWSTLFVWSCTCVVHLLMIWRMQKVFSIYKKAKQTLGDGNFEMIACDQDTMKVLEIYRHSPSLRASILLMISLLFLVGIQLLFGDNVEIFIGIGLPGSACFLAAGLEIAREVWICSKPFWLLHVLLGAVLVFRLLLPLDAFVVLSAYQTSIASGLVFLLLCKNASHPTQNDELRSSWLSPRCCRAVVMGKWRVLDWICLVLCVSGIAVRVTLLQDVRSRWDVIGSLITAIAGTCLGYVIRHLVCAVGRTCPDSCGTQMYSPMGTALGFLLLLLEYLFLSTSFSIGVIIYSLLYDVALLPKNSGLVK